VKNLIFDLLSKSNVITQLQKKEKKKEKRG